MNANTIKLEGFLELQLALKKFGPDLAAQKAMTRAVLDETLIPPARVEAPRRSGKLAGSIRSDASPTYGFILAGNRAGIPYGSVIHFGWATRGLGAGRLTGTLKERKARIETARVQSKSMLGASTVSKAARYSRQRGRKQAVRGGPIEPNPFIYRTIDRRHSEVLRAYDGQIEERAKLEALL